MILCVGRGEVRARDETGTEREEKQRARHNERFHPADAAVRENNRTAELGRRANRRDLVGERRCYLEVSWSQGPENRDNARNCLD